MVKLILVVVMMASVGTAGCAEGPRVDADSAGLPTAGSAIPLPLVNASRAFRVEGAVYAGSGVGLSLDGTHLAFHVPDEATSIQAQATWSCHSAQLCRLAVALRPGYGPWMRGDAGSDHAVMTETGEPGTWQAAVAPDVYGSAIIWAEGRLSVVVT